MASYRALLGKITPLLGLSASGSLVLVLALAFVPACGLAPRADWSASPSGSAAVAELLTVAGIAARERLVPLRDLDKDKDKESDVAQIVLLAGAEVGPEEWASLARWLATGGKTLILAPGPRPLPTWLGDIEIVTSGADGPLRATPRLEIAGRAEVQGRVVGAAWVRADVPGSDPLIVRGEHAYATVVSSESGRVIALPDGSLFTNAALAVGDNATLIAALLRLAGGPVELVGEDTGVVARTPLASVSRGRLAPFMAQLGACLILFLLMQGRAFGRLIDPEVAHRRAFAEHVRALGTQYARARATGQALMAYTAWAVERLRERIRLPGDRGIADLSAAVAERTGRPIAEIALALFASHLPGVDAASGSPSRKPDERASVEEDLASMELLRRLLIETGGGQRNRARLASPLMDDRVSSGAATSRPHDQPVGKGPL